MGQYTALFYTAPLETDLGSGLRNSLMRAQKRCRGSFLVVGSIAFLPSPLARSTPAARVLPIQYFLFKGSLVDLRVRASLDRDTRRATRGQNSTLHLHPHYARRLVWFPLRASSDHCFIVGALRAQNPYQLLRHSILRPRVARAQKISRLHPLLCSVSKKGTWPLLSHPSSR